MEILDMTFASIPIVTAIGVVALWYFSKNIWKDWREHRAFVKEIEEVRKKSDEEYEWKPNINRYGVDCGEWVRKKDGRPLRLL
jgi:hypothetical protein